MRKKIEWVAIAIVVVCAILYADRELGNPHHDILWDRKAKAVTFRKRYFEGEPLVSSEKLLIITNEQKLQELRKATAVIHESRYAANSMEGTPDYRMVITYVDGTTNTFHFNRREWGYAGTTPESLLVFLDANGL